MQNDLLKPYQWENRVLLLFAADAGNDQFEQQWEIFQDNNESILERNLVVFQLFKNKGIDPEGKPINEFQVERIRKQFNVEKGKFSLLLIGKDGTLKNRYASVTPMSNINSLIDAMPMRKAEMRRKKEEQ